MKRDQHQVRYFTIFSLAGLILTALLATSLFIYGFNFYNYHSTEHFPATIVGRNVFPKNATHAFLRQFSEEFFGKMQAMAQCQLKRQCPIRLLVYECQSFELSCGGLADRLRGLISLFYAAYASNRILWLNWQTPADLSLVFEINHVLYGVNDDLPVLFSRQRNNVFYFNMTDASLLISNQPVIRYTTVSLDLMEQVFQRPVFHNTLQSMRHIFSNYHTDMNTNYELAAFLALRTLFSKPKQLLNEAVAEIENRRPNTSGGDGNCLLGVHIRASPKNIYNRYEESPRLSRQQVEKCFVQRITNEQDVTKCSVYIASDSMEAKYVIKEHLHNQAFDSGFKPQHIDNDMRNASEMERRDALLETFADFWFLATRANRLLITRSGFGEMASTFSSFMPFRTKTTLRLPLISGKASESCDFEPDYHIRSAKIDDWRSLGGLLENKYES